MRFIIGAVALLVLMAVLAAGGAKARPVTDPGEGFLPHKHRGLGKDYYVVRKEQSQCSVVTGKWAKKPEGAVAGTPYASKEYAKAALKTFPQCKGGEADDDTGWTDDSTDDETDE